MLSSVRIAMFLASLLMFTVNYALGQDVPPAPSDLLVTTDPGTLPSTFAWFYKPPLDGNLDLLLQHFDTFILSKTDEVSRDYLIQNGVSEPILHYLLSNEIQDPGSCTIQPHRNQVADRIGDFCMISAQHPDWFLLDANGIRLSKVEGTKTMYYMDPANEEWREFWKSRAKETQDNLGWRGVFLDNIDASLRRLLRTGRQPVKYPTDASYQSAIEEYLNDLRVSYFAPEQRPLYANITEVLDPSVWFRYLPYLDGAMNETFAAYWDPQYYSVLNWEESLSRAEQSLGLGKSVLLIGNGSQADTLRQQFIYASYLLVVAPGAAYRYTKSQYHRNVWWYDNWETDIGQPLGPRFRQGNFWKREFTRGYVLVDPSTHASQIVRTTDKMVFLSWTDNSSDEDVFQIERSIDGETFELIATVPANQTIFADSNLEPGREYYYRVSASNGSGISAPSDVVSVIALWIGPKPPSAFSGEAVSSSRIDLSWSDQSDDESGFEVEQSENGTIFTRIATLYPDSIAYSVMNLTSGMTYYFRLRAYNEEGYSAYTNTIEVSTPLAAPAAPGNFIATSISSSQINLSWTDLSQDESGFRIEKSTDGQNFVTLSSPSANTTTYSHTGLTPNTQYFYRIHSFNNAGNSSFVNASATTRPVVPANPSNLTATVSGSAIRLNWIDNAVNETGFKIERSTNSTTFSQIATVSANILTYSDATAAAGTTYYYRVRAYNSGGNSGYSNTASATRPATTLPAAPSNLIATGIARTKISLTWKDNASNETGFKIERSLDNKVFTQIATVGVNVVSYTDINLTANSVYYYRVRAYNSTGNSAYSNTESGRTYR